VTTRTRRSQIVDAVLVGIALAFVVLVIATRERITTTEAEARANNLLQAYDESDITRVRFERPGGSFTLVRTKTDDAGAATWSLAEPIAEDAEPFGVQKLLGTLEFASALRKIKPEEVNRKAFGLDDPKLVIHVDMGQIKYRLRLGAEAASPAGARYLEIAGDDAPGKSIVLVPKSLVAELDLSLDEFRERYVMPYLSTSLDRLVLEGAGGTRKLRRADWHDGFRFDGMLGDVRTSRPALDRVLVQFARTRADRFIDPGAAEKALAGAQTVTITMTPIDQKSPVGVVEVGGQCPDEGSDVVALRRKPDRVAACVPKTVLSGLTTPADALVDRTLFWMRPDEVEGFEVVEGDARLAMDRKETGFVLRAPHEGEVDAEAGNGRLEAIVHATGTLVEAPDPKKLGLDPPHGHVVVRSAAADDSKVAEETVLLASPAADGTVYVEREHDHAVLALGREAARALVADSALVRDRSILDVPIADVTRVEVGTTPRQVVERRESGTLTLTSPPGFKVDGALALELCDALRTLSAERWVMDRDDGSFGLSQPSLSARLSVQSGGKVAEHVVRLGRPAGSGYYASLDADPAVFVLSRRLHEILTTLVIDRGVFVMDPQITSKITLQSGTRTVVLERRGDDFVQTDAGEPLSGDSVRKIVDTLSSLRAEAALEVGPAKPEQGLAAPLLRVRLDVEPGHPDRSGPIVFQIGSGDAWRGISIHYARVDGVDATFALARSNVRALLDAL